MKGEQLALPVQLAPTPDFDSYFAGPNLGVVAALRRCAAGTGLPSVWLYGGARSGKSHLLRAAVAAAGGDALYLALREQPGPVPSSPDVPLLALDDVDARVGEPEAALGLLRLLDQRRQLGLSTVMAAGHAPSRLQVALPDLLTRLSAMALLGIKPLQDADRRELLRRQARQRGLDLAEDVVNWLLNHLPRDAGSLLAALEALDAASLKSRHRVTLPLATRVLARPQA